MIRLALSAVVSAYVNFLKAVCIRDSTGSVEKIPYHESVQNERTLTCRDIVPDLGQVLVTGQETKFWLSTQPCELGMHGITVIPSSFSSDQIRVVSTEICGWLSMTDHFSIRRVGDNADSDITI